MAIYPHWRGRLLWPGGGVGRSMPWCSADKTYKIASSYDFWCDSFTHLLLCIVYAYMTTKYLEAVGIV